MKTSLVLESNDVVAPGVELRVSAALPSDLIAMLPDGVVIDVVDDDWDIVDVVIGNRSLREQGGLQWPLSPSEWIDAIARCKFRFETIQTRMNVEMRVIPRRPGLRFRCVLSGDAAMSPVDASDERQDPDPFS